MQQSALTAGEDQFSGRYADWHLERDWNRGAKQADIPIFAVHGVNDNAARIGALEWFFERRNPQDKVWIGQWDHGVGCCPNRRGIQWTAALHAWFDKHLARRKVNTGPPIELFMSDDQSFAAVKSGARTETLRAPRWPVADERAHLLPVGRRRDGAHGAGGGGFAVVHRHAGGLRRVRERGADVEDGRQLRHRAVHQGRRHGRRADDGARRLGHGAARAPDREPARRGRRGQAPADQPVRDQPRAAQRDRHRDAGRAGRALHARAARLRDGAPPARRPPARAPGDDVGSRQGAVLHGGPERLGVHRARRART